jgi:hypothetical protein
MSDENTIGPAEDWWQEHLARRKQEMEARLAELGQNRDRILSWCEEQAGRGELAFCWSGGGDQGMVELRGTDAEGNAVQYNPYGGGAEDPIVNLLVSMMDDLLGYGSWAGEFSAYGKARYSSEHQAFLGVDSYSSDDSEAVEFKCRLQVPDTIPFETVEIHKDSTEDVQVAMTVRNGFISEPHEAWCQETAARLGKDIGELIDKHNREANEGAGTLLTGDAYFSERYTVGEFEEQTLPDGQKTLVLEIDDTLYCDKDDNVLESNILLQIGGGKLDQAELEAEDLFQSLGHFDE